MDLYLDPYKITPQPGAPEAGENDHATRVARILIGVDPNGENDGLAPDATLYATRAIDEETFYEGVEWLLTQGVNVINASLNFTSFGTYTNVDKWADHIAMVHDVHLVVSAGNRNTSVLEDDPLYNPGYVGSSGMAYNVITVGGLNHTGNTNSTGYPLWDGSCYMERTNSNRAEKPNLIAPATSFWPTTNNPGNGTSFAAPQVTGTIAQLCGLYNSLKTKQAAMGAILMASAVKKDRTESIGIGGIGDKFDSSAPGRLNAQMSDKQGAGILNANSAKKVAVSANYWTQSITADAFPYDKLAYIDASSNSLVRIAIFWLKRNTASGTNHQNITEAAYTDLDLYVYDPSGAAVALSNESWTNFEIVQFAPTITGNYRIQIKDINSTVKETVGIAVWYD